MDYHAAIAAVLSLIACIAAVLALALPLWAWTPNMNVSAMGEMSKLEIGLWKACTLAQYRGETVRDCWSLVHDQVGPAFIAAAVLYIVGVAAGFVSFIMLLVLALSALGRDGAARVCIVLTVLTELCYAAAFGCAVGGLNESRDSADDFMDMPGMRFGASFYLGIVAMVVGLAAIPFAARVGFRAIVV